MTLLVLAIIALVFAALPAVLFLANLREYRPLPPAATDPPPISLLIPARNEEGSITAAVESALASRGVEFEVIVLDDHSEDATAARVAELVARDSRVRLAAAPPLPVGWNGKQHACHVLASLARYDVLCWVDADVRLAPDAVARIATWVRDHPHVGLLSGVPRQLTGTFLERLLIPLIHFVLLAFLPLRQMRANTNPAMGAGCGQLFVARRPGYERAGGHAAIRASRHDGIMLPRAFRRAGIATDLCDATDLATCRMYHSAGQTWTGLAKNATEAMAAPKAIGFWTVLLLTGQVLPVAIVIASTSAVTTTFAAIAIFLSTGVRLLAAHRFRQPLGFALLHPLAITTLLAVQWHALSRRLRRRPVSWKGRASLV